MTVVYVNRFEDDGYKERGEQTIPELSSRLSSHRSLSHEADYTFAPRLSSGCILDKPPSIFLPGVGGRM